MTRGRRELMNNRFVFGGYFRALKGTRDSMREQVLNEYAEKLCIVSDSERAELEAEIEREIARRTREASPSKDALY